MLSNEDSHWLCEPESLFVPHFCARVCVIGTGSVFSIEGETREVNGNVVAN